MKVELCSIHQCSNLLEVLRKHTLGERVRAGEDDAVRLL